MPWIKKNLMLVLGGLVGLILLGGSGFFLYTQHARESTVHTELEAKRAEWERVNSLVPFPDEKNIAAAKDEAARLDKLGVQLKENVRPVELPPVTDTLSLRVLVETSISQLKKEAESSGVTIPDKFAFTFQKLREMPQVDSNSIPKLAEQISQVALISRVLYRAKVHSLDTLRRVPILKDEGGSDYLTKKSVTNALVIRTPYDFSFRCFSSELAEVIKGLAALDQCVVIKTINVDPTTLPTKAAPTFMPTPLAMNQSGATPLGGGGMDAAMRARYGLMPPGGGSREEGGGATPPGGMDAALRARYGLPGAGGAPGGADMMRSRYGGGGAMAPPPPALSNPSAGIATVAPVPTGPAVVLDERPLRVILQVDFIKPKPSAPESPRRAASPARGPATAADVAAPAGDPAEATPQ